MIKAAIGDQGYALMVPPVAVGNRTWALYVFTEDGAAGTYHASHFEYANTTVGTVPSPKYFDDLVQAAGWWRCEGEADEHFANGHTGMNVVYRGLPAPVFIAGTRRVGSFVEGGYIG